MTEEKYSELSNREKFIYCAFYQDNKCDKRTKVILAMLEHLDFTGQYMFASPERIATELNIRKEDVRIIYAELESGDNPILIKKNEGFYSINTERSNKNV